MLDKIDSKLLLSLLENSRMPISKIAKSARISRNLANYRINRLKKLGIIRDFTTTINTKKLSYVSALLFLSIKAEKETEFMKYLNGLNFVSWAGTQLGFWSIGLAIYGKSVEEVEINFKKIFLKYGDYITNHRFEFYKNTKFFFEKYFGGKAKLKQKDFFTDYKIDEYDKKILKLISKNSRLTSVELSKVIPLTPVAISNRIKKLEKSDYILGYSLFINTFKLGLSYFIFFIKNNKLEHRKKLYTYLENHPNVSILLDYVGDPFIEFSLFAKDPYKIRSFLQEIKETFPENELVDFFMVQEDFISYEAPDCVFE